MVGKDQNDLFDLVHSFTPAEKRYFKQHAGQHTRNSKSNYIILFDAVAEMPEWSLEALRKAVPEIANLAATMNQLTNLIFKVLGQLSRKHNPIHQLRDLMVAIENAHDKGLWNHYRKWIGRAEKLAEKHEKYQILLELAAHKRVLLYRNAAPQAEVMALEKTEADLLENIRIDSHYGQLYHLVAQKLKLKSRVSKQGKQELEDFLHHGLIEHGPQGNSLISRITYHNIKGMIAFALGNLNEYYLEYEQVLELWRTHPHQIETNQSRFLEHLHSFLGSWSLRDDGEGYRKALDQFREVEIKSDSARFKKEELLHIHEFLHFLNFGGYETGKVYVESLIKWIQKNQSQVSAARRLLFHHNIAVFYFLHDESSAARKALKEILRYQNTSARADIRNFARIFDLVLLFELRRGDPDYYESLLDSRYRSVVRSLDRKEEIAPMEKEVLKFLKKTEVITTPKERKKNLLDAKAALEEIRDTPGGRPPLGCHELLFWLEARIEGIPLRELFEKKLEERR